MATETNSKVEKVEKLAESEARILAEISLDFLNPCRKEALKHLNSHLDLPGFRKGMVPEDILIKTVGEGAVLEETAEIALSKEYGNILKEANLKPITRPEIKILKLAPGIPLSFEIVVATEPEFDLPDYKKLAGEVKEEAKSVEDGSPDSQSEFRDKEKRQMKMLEALVKETKMSFPKRFLDSESAHMLSHFKQDLEKAGLKWEEYLEKIKKSEAEVLESFKEQIIYRAKTELIITKIAEKEGLKTYGDVFDFLEKQSTT